MRFMILVKATRDSEAGTQPSETLFAEMAAYHEALAKAGVLLDGSGLKPSSKGWRIRYSGDKRTIVDGPFAEAKELVAGYWQLEAKSLDEVLEWMKKAPFDGGVELQVRPVIELDDFDEVLTPEIRERQQRIEKKLQQR